MQGPHFPASVLSQKPSSLNHHRTRSCSHDSKKKIGTDSLQGSKCQFQPQPKNFRLRLKIITSTIQGPHFSASVPSQKPTSLNHHRKRSCSHDSKRKKLEQIAETPSEPSSSSSHEKREYNSQLFQDSHVRKVTDPCLHRPAPLSLQFEISPLSAKTVRVQANS